MYTEISLFTGSYLLVLCPDSRAGDNGSEWVKHWVKGGHDYYYNLNTREGTWVEQEGFLQNNTQLNKDDIQVGYWQEKSGAMLFLSSRRKSKH